MKIIIGLFMALIASISYAQNASEWKITQVTNEADMPLGYVLHIYAVGTEAESVNKFNKTVAGFRLICSVAGPDENGPLIGVFWDHPQNDDAIIEPTWTVDGKVIPTSQWAHERSLFYKPASVATELIAAMKTGHKAAVTWTNSDGIKYNTIFNLNGFSTKLGIFNTDCSTSI